VRVSLAVLRRPRPTEVFESYWRFASERQRIFRARLRGVLPPLTDDPVLARFKFTNAYRASDRTSQYLIRNVIYDRSRPFQEVFARVILFKFFNRIETWELLCDAVGDIDVATVMSGDLEHVLQEAMKQGEKIYSAAYIIPSAGQFGSRRKHVNHLRLLRAMLKDHAEERILDAPTLAQAFEVLRSYPSIGPFLGYQLAIDLNYTSHLQHGEDDYVVPGPGAYEGLEKCFSDPGDLSPSAIIQWTMETQMEQFAVREIDFADLWGRPLQLIDCQNLFCEIAKYARAAHPNVTSANGRNRIKQRFKPLSQPLAAWYPPKWGINNAVEEWRRATPLVGATRARRR
jgi:hypothetical protein